jgi:hypothetical protein
VVVGVLVVALQILAAQEELVVVEMETHQVQQELMGLQTLAVAVVEVLEAEDLGLAVLAVPAWLFLN